jgi:hypothetical protein
MKLTEGRLRRIIREEIIDVEPYEDTLAKVTGNYYGSSSEVSVEVRLKNGQPVIYTFNNRGKTLSKVELGRKEAQKIANALS